MKPNVALLFSLDAVEVLLRNPAGWLSLGRVRFDAHDLDEQLDSFRASAKRHGADPMRSKLVLPASEVRYATVFAPGPTDEARRLQIETEIERLTPYTLDEISFDWVIEGDNALIALAARETQAEAEDFAQARGFAPVSFAAIPDAGQFIGEPFLGHTKLAASLLPKGTKIEPDLESVRVAGTVAAFLENTDAPTKAIAPQATPVTKAPEGVTAPTPASPAPDPAPEKVKAAQAKAPEAAPKPVVDAAAPKPAAPTPAPTPALPRTQPGAAQPKAQSPAKPSAEAPTDEGLQRIGNFVRRLGTQMRRERADASGTAGKKPASASTPPPAAPARPGPAPVPAPVAPPPAPATGEATVPVAFSSRRKQPSDAAPARQTGLAVAASSTPKPGPGPGGRIAVVGQAMSGGALGALRQRAAGVVAGVTGRTRALSARAKAKLNAVRPEPKLPEPIVPASRPATNDRVKATEAEALTIFGARQSQQIEGGSRRGLMLAGALALLLVAVGIWAAFLGREAGPLPQVAQAPDTSAPIQVPAPASQPEQQVAESDAAPVEDLADPDALMEELVREALTETAPVDSLPEIAQADTEADPLPLDALDEAQAAEAPPAEGADDAAQPTSTQISEAPEAAALPAASVPSAPDETLQTRLALAQPLIMPAPLQAPDVSETRFVAPLPPPPFGVEFDLSEDGLVVPTPEGALSPEGILIREGRPAVVPSPRPDGLAPEAAALPPAPEVSDAVAEALGLAEAEAPEPEAEPEIIFDDTPRADPALAGVRPRPRSERVSEIGRTLQPPADDTVIEEPDLPGDSGALDGDILEGADRAALDGDAEVTARADAELPDTPVPGAEAPGPGAIALAALRPQARPSDLSAAVAAAAADPDDDTLPEAVAVSRLPAARPGDMEARVRAALAATAAPAAQPRAQAASAGPQIPTSASVAERATQTRAINLREINLIGVFGTPSDRRALVRLSDGRVVRLQVGDTLNGGRVSAIGDDELRYTRSGRNEVLRIGRSG